MILIADSGGSKTDWTWIHKTGNTKSIKSAKFNPYNQPAIDLKKSIQEEVIPYISCDVQYVFFYGAGITSVDNKKIVVSILDFFFKKATIEVHSDLLGTAKALCGDNPGLVCILGTGSNCGQYNGEKIYSKIPNLGWILNDKGSGSYLGKRLIEDYFHKTMPMKISVLFHNQYPWNHDTFLQHIYKKKGAAEFLGSFSYFVAMNIHHSYCHHLVYSGFDEFLKKNVMGYNNYRSMKIYFSGSIAFYYKNILEQVTTTLQISIGSIIKKPIENLTLYHYKKLIK